MEQGVFMTVADRHQLNFDLEKLVMKVVKEAKPEPTQNWRSSKELATHLGVGYRTVQRMIAEDPALPKRRIRNRWRFNLAEVDKYFQNKKK